MAVYPSEVEIDETTTHQPRLTTDQPTDQSLDQTADLPRDQTADVPSDQTADQSHDQTADLPRVHTADDFDDEKIDQVSHFELVEKEVCSSTVFFVFQFTVLLQH